MTANPICATLIPLSYSTRGGTAIARQARKRGRTDYYHLIVRGIGKQVLFEQPADYRYYLKQLEKCSEECCISICAYCLMENHVHLLVRDPDFCQSLFMKKLGICYALYFNEKYERTGHLFQDRFLSELIENEQYLLNVFRYILNNPVKAGLCSAAAYGWSSYGEYDREGSFVDTSIFHELIGDRDAFRRFMCVDSDGECLDYDSKKGWENYRAQQVISSYLDGKSGTVLQSMERKERDRALRELKGKGLTVRQLERLTGINRNVIQRA